MTAVGLTDARWVRLVPSKHSESLVAELHDLHTSMQEL